MSIARGEGLPPECDKVAGGKFWNVPTGGRHWHAGMPHPARRMNLVKGTEIDSNDEISQNKLLT
jgi:hypothetical protein